MSDDEARPLLVSPSLDEIPPRLPQDPAGTQCIRVPLVARLLVQYANGMAATVQDLMHRGRQQGLPSESGGFFKVQLELPIVYFDSRRSEVCGWPLNEREDTMVKLKSFVIAILLLAAVAPSLADSAKLAGTWKLVSYEAEYQSGGAKEPVLGKKWVGYVFFTPEGRVFTVMTAEGRQPPSTDQDRSDLYKSMLAYTGQYRLDGEALTLKADVSWNPAWLTGDQARTVKFEGDRLHVLTGWTQAIAKPEKGMARGILVLEKVK